MAAKSGLIFVKVLRFYRLPLINNDIESSSSKNKKAKSLGVQIINEEQFMQLIGE